MGLVVTTGGAPLSGYALTVTDLPGGPRSDVSVSEASDGSFRARLTSIPGSEPPQTPAHHLILAIHSAATVPVYREAYLHAGQAVDLGTIMAQARDPNVTVVGPAGGTATDSQGFVQVQIPAGALSQPTPIVITPHLTRAQVPFKLPDATVTTYAMTFEPDGTQFAAPITVNLKNWRNLPTSGAIPVAYADIGGAVWRNISPAQWNGAVFSFETTHFCVYDANHNNTNGIEVITYDTGRDSTNSVHRCGMGSAVGLANGTLRQDIALPSYSRLGTNYVVSLGYDSQQVGEPPPAGSTMGGTAGGYEAVPQAASTTFARSGVLSVSCVPRSQADAVVSKSDGSCLGGTCSTGGGLAVPLTSLGQSTSWNGSLASPTQPISVPGGALDVELSQPSALPLAPNGSVATPFFATRHTEISNTAGTTCVSLGGAFNEPSSGTSSVQTNQVPGPLVSLDEEVFIHQNQSSAVGAGWAIDQVDRLYAATPSDLAVVVHGNGDQETFSPRAALAIAPNDNLPRAYYALATDPVTGQVLLARQTEIDVIDPTSGATSAVVPGLAFPSAPLAMAVTYVAGVQHMVVALDTELVDVNGATATQRVLMPRAPIAGETGNRMFTFVPGVAASNDLAFYVSGVTSDPTLYSIRLSDANPVPQAITLTTGGDPSLDPLVPLSQFTLADPHGLAYIRGQGLYIADRQRDVVYLAAP